MILRKITMTKHRDTVITISGRAANSTHYHPTDTFPFVEQCPHDCSESNRDLISVEDLNEEHIPNCSCVYCACDRANQ